MQQQTPASARQQHKRESGTMGGASSSNGEESRRFAAEWRQDVSQAFRDQAQVNKDTTRALVELTTVVSALKVSVDDMRNRPATTLSVFGTYGGCIAQALYAGLSSTGVLISIVSVVIALTHGR